jgi:hypothetical protein
MSYLVDCEHDRTVESIACCTPARSNRNSAEWSSDTIRDHTTVIDQRRSQSCGRWAHPRISWCIAIAGSRAAACALLCSPLLSSPRPTGASRVPSQAGTSQWEFPAAVPPPPPPPPAVSFTDSSTRTESPPLPPAVSFTRRSECSQCYKREGG